MPERNWEREAQENLQEFERRQASVLHNSSLARWYIERGVAVALVVVFTCFGSTLRAISQGGRNLFLACSIFGALIAVALVSIGVTGMIHQQRQRQAPTRREDEPPAIGW
jgi:hypothetical protein